MQHEGRIKPREDVVQLVAVHLDVNGADRCPIRHDAEIAEEMLDGVVGEQRHAVVGPDAAVAEERGDAACDLPQLAVGDGSPVVGADDPRLLRIALRGVGNPVSQQLRT